jgi:predicted NAD/FAD-binding protein
MPRRHAPLDIAVIGTGIARMSAARLLSSVHRVTVYEQADRLGGHSNTVEVPGPDGPVAMDTGFIVYNEATYPNLTALFHHLGVRPRAGTCRLPCRCATAHWDTGALGYWRAAGYAAPASKHNRGRDALPDGARAGA